MQKIFLPLLVITLLLTACGGNLSEPISIPISNEAIASPMTPDVIFTSTPMPSSTPMWYWTDSLVNFTDMSILPNNEAWIASSHGLVMRQCINGDCNFSFPSSTYTLEYYCGTAIDFLSANDGWLIGCPVGIYHWDGAKWKIQRPDDKKRALLDIGFADPNSGWAVGYISDVVGSNFHLEGVILHWNGTEWQDISVLEEIGRNDFSLNAIDVVSENDVWVVGDTVLHWNGAKWREIPTPQYTQELENVSAISPTDVWVAGRGFVLHWNGHNWANFAFGSYVDNVLAISTDDVWVAGAALYHWDGKQWNNAHFDEGRGNSIEKMVLAPDGNTWALTNAGNIYLLGTRHTKK